RPRLPATGRGLRRAILPTGAGGGHRPALYRRAGAARARRDRRGHSGEAEDRGGVAVSAAYPWLKALHIIAVIAWMAGLLYLPRLFVYHAEAPRGSDRAMTFAVMERRLMRGIMLPALVMTYAFGIALAATPGAVDWGSGWIWAQLALVLLLTLFHA